MTRIKTLLTVLALLLITGAFSQNLELTFTAVDNTTYIQLDSIKIMNRTQGGEIMSYYPDTTISLEIIPGDLLLYIGYATFNSPVGVQEISKDGSQFQLFQNYPNPMADQGIISMWVPEAGEVNVKVMDVQGRVILANDWKLDQGIQTFRFIPGDGNLLFFNASWNGMTQTIKILTSEPNHGKICSLEYTGSSSSREDVLKASSQQNDFISKQSGKLDRPAENRSYTFEFATNLPCPGTPTVVYEGQVYNTVQIYSLCWLKENLNAGTMIPGMQEMANNSVIEKYCYDDNPANCVTYGGLYEWNEIMQYTTQESSQGVCPPGWHIPSDEEWKVLCGSVDSQYRIGDPEWDILSANLGYDVGTHLKSGSGWDDNGNGTDLFGFSGRPGGMLAFPGTFGYKGSRNFLWTSSQSQNQFALARSIGNDFESVYYHQQFNKYGYSVRCLRD